MLWRIVAGAAVGFGVGTGLAALFFRARPARLRLAENGEGFVALAATFGAYGLAEVIEGYGFIAVFVCAVAIRAAERDHGYHNVLHDYIEQVERLLTVVVLVLLGGAVARGLFAELTWQQILLAAVVLVVVRPAAGWVGLYRSGVERGDRAAISSFGIRGIGSLYYLSYGLGEGEFSHAETLWGVVGLVVVGSVVLHGVTATPVMGLVDRMRGDRSGEPPA